MSDEANEKVTELNFDTSNEKANSLPDEAAQFFSKLIGLSAKETVNALNKKEKLNNVAILVDYDNVYWTLTKNYSHNPNHEDQSKNLFDKLWDKYRKDNVRSFRAYADFEKIRTELTSLQKKRVQIRHVYSNGKDVDKRKNSSDIELCIDAIELSYRDPSISCFVFVTADSDMIPIMSRMMYKGKRVELYYLSKAAPQHVDITSYAHHCEDLLTFLNIEVKEYKLADYIDKALLFIRDWHHQYSHNPSLYLGRNWLKSQLSIKLSIPENLVSQLIESLMVDDLITEDRKEVLNNNTKETKLSISLTPKGNERIDKIVELVAVSEHCQKDQQ